MFRNLLSLIVMGSLVISVGCASKKKAGDDVATGDVSADSSVGTRDMSFDPMGSDSGNIQGLKTVHFEYDDASLSTNARKTLAENAEWIKSNGNTTIQVEGHCDGRGSVEYNLALGERRAKSVANYLNTLGIDKKRLTIISYGKEKPVAQGEGEEVWAKNRRANFVPLPN